MLLVNSLEVLSTHTGKTLATEAEYELYKWHLRTYGEDKEAKYIMSHAIVASPHIRGRHYFFRAFLVFVFEFSFDNTNVLSISELSPYALRFFFIRNINYLKLCACLLL